MARIAVIDPSGRIAATVQAVLGGDHKIVARARLHAPGDADLVVVDLRRAELQDPRNLRSLSSFGPVLLLVDRRDPVPASVQEHAGLAVLRKPFDAFELRLLVERLLREAGHRTTRAAQAERETGDLSAWLEFPFVPAPAGAVLRSAGDLAAPLWIFGEPGCGRQRIALAVCRFGRRPLKLVTWFADERLDELLRREGKRDCYALFAPEIEARGLPEQERLATVLAGDPGFRLIATSVEDPAERVVAGSFSRQLYHRLLGLAVQISPLRERPIAIPPLAQVLGGRIARRLGHEGNVSYTSEAMARLQTYLWPGNLVELEAVLHRTLTALVHESGRDWMVEADDLLFTPASARRSRRSGAKEKEKAKSEERKSDRRDIVMPTSADLEQLMAGLAHDLRNPMVTIKTFAGLISSAETSDESARELGNLTQEACERIDRCLAALQEYAAFGEPVRERVDLAELVRESLAERDPSSAARVVTDLEVPLEVSCDRAQVRFAIDRLLDAGLAELDGEHRLEINAPEEGAVCFVIPVGQRPATKLRKVVGSRDDAGSWRVLLARAIVKRNGGKVDVDAAGRKRRIRCVLPRGEEGVRGRQTNRSNR